MRGAGAGVRVGGRGGAEEGEEEGEKEDPGPFPPPSRRQLGVRGPGVAAGRLRGRGARRWAEPRRWRRRRRAAAEAAAASVLGSAPLRSLVC